MNAINALGLKLDVNDWNKSDQLPLYILNNFSIQKATLNDIDCLSLTPHEELPILSVLKKQIAIIKNIENLGRLRFVQPVSLQPMQQVLSRQRIILLPICCCP